MKSFRYYWCVFSIFGFFEQFQPIQSFLVSYLIDIKHLTNREVYQEVFVIWTYSILGWYPLVGILSEFLGYRLVIFCGLIARIFGFCLLIWGQAKWLFQINQVCEGFFFASQVIFIGCVYRFIPQHCYHSMSFQLVLSLLLGNVGSAFLGQLLKNLGVSLPILMYVSFGSTLLCFLFFFLFPRQEMADKRNVEPSPEGHSADSPPQPGPKPCVQPSPLAQPTLNTDQTKASQEPPLPERAECAAVRTPSLSALPLADSEPGHAPPTAFSINTAGPREDPPKLQPPPSPTTAHTRPILPALHRSHVKCLLHSVARLYASRILRWTLWLAAFSAIHELECVYWQNLYRKLDPHAKGNGFLIAGAYLGSSVLSQLARPERVKRVVV